MTASKKAEKTAGLTSGNVTLRKVVRTPFPEILEASSSVESMDFIAARTTRYTIGTLVNVWTKMSPAIV